MFRLPFSPVENIIVSSWPELPYPTSVFTAEYTAPIQAKITETAGVDDDPYWTRLMTIPDQKMSELNHAYITSYEVKEAISAQSLHEGARTILGSTNPVGMVYDAAIIRGFTPLGIAPAKQAYKLPGNPRRVYAGRHKPHLQPLSIFSPDS